MKATLYSYGMKGYLCLRFHVEQINLLQVPEEIARNN